MIQPLEEAAAFVTRPHPHAPCPCMYAKADRDKTGHEQAHGEHERCQIRHHSEVGHKAPSHGTDERQADCCRDQRHQPEAPHTPPSTSAMKRCPWPGTVSMKWGWAAS